MKKLTVLLLAGVLAGSVLTGCGSKKTAMQLMGETRKELPDGEKQEKFPLYQEKMVPEQEEHS